MLLILKSPYLTQKLYVSLTPSKQGVIKVTKIVFKPLRTNLFHIVLLASFITLGTGKIYSQGFPGRTNAKPPVKQSDNPKSSISEPGKKDVKTAQDTIKPKKSNLTS